MESGYYDFQLVAGSSTELSTIVVQNTWRNPVQFVFTQPGTPLTAMLVVDENDSGKVSTAQEWTINAVVNGITTSSVTINDPNATCTVIASNDGGGFVIVVS